MAQQRLAALLALALAVGATTRPPAGRFRARGLALVDLCVVGGGPVGVRAAVNAAQRGLSTVLIDAPQFSGVLADDDGEDLSLGGPTGLFSKALRDISHRLNVESLRGMGLNDRTIFQELRILATTAASVSARDARYQLSTAGVDLVSGFATLGADSGTGEVEVEVREGPGASAINAVRARKVLLATGSTPYLPSSIPFDGYRVFDSDTINGLTFLPRSVVITGSGIIALEYAKIFRNLGASVTLVVRDRVPMRALRKIGLDKDVAACVLTDLIRAGVTVVRGAEAVGFDVPESLDQSVTVTLKPVKGGAALETTSLKADIYMAAVGRTPNTGFLKRNAAGVDLDEYGCIVVDTQLETTRHGVFAAGDVVGRPSLASTGVAQGTAAVSAMFDSDGADGGGGYDPDAAKRSRGLPRLATGANYDPMSLNADAFAYPVGIWSSPEIAYFGLTLEQAAARGVAKPAESIALYKECLRGCVFAPQGLLKLVYDGDSGRIYGVHIVGDDACELVHYGMELVRAERTVGDVLRSTYSAVTFHELYQIAAGAALDPAAARKRRRLVGAAERAGTKRVSPGGAAKK